MKSWLQKKWNNGKMLAELKPAFFLSLTFCFMIFIYAPLELYINNVDEFWYDVYLLFPFIIKDFFLFLLFSIVGFLVVYLFGNVAYKIVLYCYFTGTVACYIQGNYMVKNLPPLDGTDVNWSLYQSQFVKSTIVWVIIAIVCLILFIVLKYDRIKKAVSYISVFLLLILVSTITVLSINNNIFEKKEYARFTKVDQFEMSTDTNFIIFLLDAVDEECFWQVWQEHPEYEDAMNDFTFYNNAMSGYAYTEHSLPLILSGEWFENKEFSTEDGNGTIANTFHMFVDREPRFYANIHFPNQRVSYAYPNEGDSYQDSDGYGIVDYWYKGLSGNGSTPGDKNTTGFSVRKGLPLNYCSSKEKAKDTWNLNVPFPIIRLGEVYLNYAEALNEYYGESRQDEVLEYLNAIRERAGIPGYEDSYSQEEMREMIRHERKIELCYECQRFFDVRRWFIAHGPNGAFNHNEYGLDMSKGENATDKEFFSMTEAAIKRFDIKHYLMPIKASECELNTELVQAPFY